MTVAFKDCFPLHDMEHANKVIEVDKSEGGVQNNDVRRFNNDGPEKMNHLRHTSLPLEMEVNVIPGIYCPFEIPIVTFRGPNLSSKLLLQLTKEVAKRAVELIGS